MSAAGRRSRRSTSATSGAGASGCCRGALPNFHSFRHTAASHAIAAGESAEEVSWQLGHRNSVVTRAVYVHELKTAERTARRRQRMEAESAPFLPSAGGRAVE